ncbi:MAG: stage III sporulation protein SpoIIIAB [Clostridia bacterium]|nr:stage III sporulation protein SpoIIIAB [Clostridia bacterium]
MILKVIGSLIIILASSFLGYSFSRDCSKRPQELRALQTMLKMFENEIIFLSNILSDAFEKISRSNKSQAADFFRNTVEILKNEKSLNASDAWEKAVKNSIGKTSLNREDEEILVSFGRMLGSSDVEGQIKNIEMTVNQLKLQEYKAEEAKKKYETLYKTLGVLGGLTIVIVLV